MTCRQAIGEIFVTLEMILIIVAIRSSLRHIGKCILAHNVQAGILRPVWQIMHWLLWLRKEYDLSIHNIINPFQR